MAPAQLSSSLWTRPHFPHLVPLVNLWTATPVSNYFLRQLDDISAASRYMDPYAFLATDPRLFFEGFPLRCSQQEQPEFIQEAHSRARRCDQRFLHHVSLGFGAIQRVERVSLPDGTTYSLFATWAKDPHFKSAKEAANQTS